MNAEVSLPTEAQGDLGAMLRKSVRDFCARNQGVARTRRLRDTLPGLDRSVWTSMADAGWTAIAIPEADNGLGLGLAELCVVAEELAADLAPEPFAPAAIATLAIARGDNAQLRSRLLPAIASGEMLAVIAAQETANTSDWARPGTSLSKSTKGGFILQGEKCFIAGAAGADGYAVTAMAESGPAIAWVPADAPGVVLAGELCVDGSWLHTIRFENVEVDAGDLAASPVAALSQLDRMADEAAVIGAAELLGVICAAFDRTQAYVAQRTQFGKPIGSFQVLQHRLVDLWMQRELVRALLDDAIDAGRSGDAARRSLTASAVKAKAAAAALGNGRQAIQLHGAIGYADEHDIGLYLKRAIVRSAWMGSAQVHRRRLAGLFGYNGQE